MSKEKKETKKLINSLKRKQLSLYHLIGMISICDGFRSHLIRTKKNPGN